MKNCLFLVTLLITITFSSCYKELDELPSAENAVVETDSILTIKNGQIMLANKPYYTIGFNKYDLFQQILAQYFTTGFGEWNPDKRRKAAEDALCDLDSLGFNLIRVFGATFTAAQLNQTFFNDVNRTVFLLAYDEMLTMCAKFNQRVVFSLGWNLAAFSDRRNETLAQLITDKNSLSRKDFELYVRTMVQRHRFSKTIAMWEFANELNLKADLGSNAVPGFTSQQLATFYKDMYQFIRTEAGDNVHIITTGDSNPRGQQFNLNEFLVRTGNWDTRNFVTDTYQQTATMLKLVNAEADVTRIHFYGLPTTTAPRSITDYSNMSKTIGANNTAKPLMIGEIAPKVSDTNFGWDQSFSRQQLQSILNEVVTQKVPITLFWSFQVDSRFHPTSWDIRKNGRSGADNDLLTLIRNAKNQLSQ